MVIVRGDETVPVRRQGYGDDITTASLRASLEDAGAALFEVPHAQGLVVARGNSVK
jgi:hypothetical protein